MKTFSSIISMILVIFLLYSCSATSDRPNGVSDEVSDSVSANSSESSFEQSTTQNETKTLLWKTVTKNSAGVTTNAIEYDYDSNGKLSSMTNTNETVSSVTYYQYDELGYVCKEETKTKSGNFISCLVYENNDTGKVLKMSALDQTGTVQTETINLYDDDGRIIQEQVDGQIIKDYTYDSNGNYTVTFPGSDRYSKYDKNGNILESVDSFSSTTYSYSNNLLSEVLMTTDDVIYKTAYEYTDGCVTKQVNYENNEISLVYTYEYDDNMNLIKDTVANALGIAQSINEYEYKDFEIQEH